MSYPQGPAGNPGYSRSQQPTTQFSAPSQPSPYGRAPESAPAAPPAGESKLPFFLTVAVAALGLLVYLSSFGPVYTVSSGSPFGDGASISIGTGLYMSFAIIAALLAALVAGVGLLPNQKARTAHVAVLSALAFLLVLAEVFSTPESVSIAWGFYLIIAFTVIQAIVAVAVLLFDAGVLTPPVPKPRYEQPQYGQYGGPQGGQYYQPHQSGPPTLQQGPPQRPSYPPQYGGGYPGGQQSGGYQGGGQPGGQGGAQGGPGNGGQNGGQSGGQGGGQQSGPPTPPTGFPAYGQPQVDYSAPTEQASLQNPPRPPMQETTQAKLPPQGSLPPLSQESQASSSQSDESPS